MNPQVLAEELGRSKEYFDRSSRCLKEQHSTFAPCQGVFTVAQVVAHVAHTVDWFIEGAFRPEGFDLDFERIAAETNRCQSLAEARAWLDRAYSNAIEQIGSRSMEELLQPLPPGPIMGGAPRLAIIGAICDHTAHHRGALTVYSRLCGLTPPMPYMDADMG